MIKRLNLALKLVEVVLIIPVNVAENQIVLAVASAFSAREEFRIVRIDFCKRNPFRDVTRSIPNGGERSAQRIAHTVFLTELFALWITSLVVPVEMTTRIDLTVTVNQSKHEWRKAA